MQAVILAGGRGTRLRPLTERMPKAMVLIQGKPFLEHQLNLLHRHGVDEAVLCIGYLGEQIERYFGDGKRFGIHLRYSWEEQLLGTGGALKQAEPFLHDRFFVLYGDSYLLYDYQAIMRWFEQSDKLALMVVLRNEDRWDRSNVVVEGSLVKVYDKRTRVPGMVYIDAGLSALRKEALASLVAGKVASLEELYQPLIAQKQLLAYETQQRFYEVGSLQGLAEFQDLVTRGTVQL